MCIYIYCSKPLLVDDYNGNSSTSSRGLTINVQNSGD